MENVLYRGAMFNVSDTGRQEHDPQFLHKRTEGAVNKLSSTG